MHDDDESCVDVIRETFEKHLQGMNAAGGGSDANRRKAVRFLARCSPSSDGWAL